MDHTFQLKTTHDDSGSETRKISREGKSGGVGHENVNLDRRSSALICMRLRRSLNKPFTSCHYRNGEVLYTVFCGDKIKFGVFGTTLESSSAIDLDKSGVRISDS